jgi:hypothetical protein
MYKIPIGAVVSFPKVMGNGIRSTTFGKVVDHDVCPFTDAPSAVIKCEGEESPRILPHSVVTLFRVN